MALWECGGGEGAVCKGTWGGSGRRSRLRAPLRKLGTGSPQAGACHRAPRSPDMSEVGTWCPCHTPPHVRTAPPLAPTHCIRRCWSWEQSQARLVQFSRSARTSTHCRQASQPGLFLALLGSCQTEVTQPPAPPCSVLPAQSHAVWSVLSVCCVGAWAGASALPC